MVVSLPPKAGIGTVGNQMGQPVEPGWHHVPPWHLCGHKNWFVCGIRTLLKLFFNTGFFGMVPGAHTNISSIWPVSSGNANRQWHTYVPVLCHSCATFVLITPPYSKNQQKRLPEKIVCKCLSRFQMPSGMSETSNS